MPAPSLPHLGAGHQTRPRRLCHADASAPDPSFAIVISLGNTTQAFRRSCDKAVQGREDALSSPSSRRFVAAHHASKRCLGQPTDRVEPRSPPVPCRQVPVLSGSRSRAGRADQEFTVMPDSSPPRKNNGMWIPYHGGHDR